MDVLSQHFTKSKLLKYTLPTMAMMLVSSAYGIIDGLLSRIWSAKMLWLR
ncbi:hypothetical protein [uncultured Senegalimassilia sp.]|nr:hypothetical protein [uncultured Senegalimassilia sp.]